MFYGKVVKAGKPLPLVPHPDGYSLHLSQASLPASVKEGSRVSLMIKVADEEPVVLCTLRAGAQDTVPLDQFLDEYAELSVDGTDGIHVTGYYSPQFGGEAESEEEGEEYEDDEYGVHPVHTVFGEPGSSDEEDSDEDESDDEDETDDEDEDIGDDVAHRKEPSVIIEDITDKDKEQQPKALPAPVDSKKRKAEAAADAAPKKQALDKQQLQNGQQQQQQQPKQQPKEKADKPQQQQKEQKQQVKQQQQQGKQEQQQQKLKQKQKEQQQQQAANATDGKADGSPAAQPVSSKKGVRRYENGFEVHSVRMGDPHGKLAKAGKQVKVKYVGKLKKTGQVFDKTQGKPLCFRLGVGQVIKGWDAGVEGMRVGDARKLVIPPQMAYGAKHTGPIPPNSTLEFEVELVDVK